MNSGTRTKRRSCLSVVLVLHGISVSEKSSLGCSTAHLTAYRRNVLVRNIILDGTADMSLGICNKPVSKFAGCFLLLIGFNRSAKDKTEKIIRLSFLGSQITGL